jgi:cell division septation protein DedD
MARHWRTAVLAAFAAAMLACACAPGAFAQSAEEGGAKAEKKAKKKQDPAEAQRVIEAAQKQLQAGKAEQAVQALTATVAGGNLPPAILAKALYVRGVAHRRQGRPAQAISDLASALWLRGGLGGDEREEAVKEKAQAYADAGLADSGEGRAPKTKSAAEGSNWLSGIFAGGSQEPPGPPPAPKISAVPAERAETPPPSAPKASAPKVAVGAAWTSKTEVETITTEAEETPPSAPPPKSGPPKAAKTAKATPSPEPSAKKAEGRYLVQLAAKRTEEEALALAAKAKREHASLLGSRSQSLDRAVFGNMGAFYRVRFGPFESAQETQSVCAKLQGSGIDCLPVNR